jgi:hypothetical protein
VYARIRDAEDRISVHAVVTLGPSLEPIDTTTGWIIPTIPLSTGKFIEDQTSSQYRADQAEAGAIDEAHNRGLRVTGFVGNLGLNGLPADVAALQVQQPTQNLLGKWAGRYITTGGTALGEETLAAMRLAPGVTISIWSRIRRASGSGVPQLYIRFRQGSTTIQQVTVSSDSQNWRVIGQARLTIPAGTTSIQLAVPPPTGGGTVEVGESTLTRGPLMMSFEEPPGRPGREDIDIWQGALNPNVQRSDGARLLAIASGMRIYEAADHPGPNAIVFDEPYQAAPAVIVLGPMAFNASLGTSLDQYRREFADGVTSHGIGKVIMQMENMSGTSYKTQDFPAAVLNAQNDARDLGGSGLTNYAGDGKYTGHYEVRLSCGAENDGFSRIIVRVVVALDLKYGAEVFTERATAQYSVSAMAGSPPGSLTALNESILGIDGRLLAGHQARLRLKSVEVDARHGGGWYNVAVTPKQLSYTAYTASTRPQTPPGSGRKGLVIVFGAT